MTGDANSMIIAKDQSWSWAMMSLRDLDKGRTPASVPKYFFFLGRNAIYHSLRLLEIPRGAEILVPAYICRAAVDPLLAYGAEVRFYAINRNCETEFSDLQRQISAKTKAVLAAHYFGFPQPVKRLRELCDRNDLVLIEDCAHVLSGEADGQPMGTFGDVAIFSWRKFLPVHDGAELVMNRPRQIAKIDWTKESPLFTLRVGINMLEGSLGQGRQPVLKVFHQGFRIAEAAVRKCASSYLRKSTATHPQSNTLVFDPQSVNWPMSRLSRWTKTHSNIENIVSRRRHNYEILREELSSLRTVTPLFPCLPESVCPWVFPLQFENLSEAHVVLRRQGIPAVTWGGVRHPDIPKDDFKDADFLYQNLVFLPVHQCLSDKDVLQVAKTVKSLCAK